MIYFLSISMYFHTRLTAEAHPADGEFLRVAINRDKCLKMLPGRAQISVISESDGKHFKPE